MTAIYQSVDWMSLKAKRNVLAVWREALLRRCYSWAPLLARLLIKTAICNCRFVTFLPCKMLMYAEVETHQSTTFSNLLTPYSKIFAKLSRTFLILSNINSPACCVIQLPQVTWDVSAFCEACCVVLKIQASNFGPCQQTYYSVQTCSGSFRCLLCSVGLSLVLCDCREQLMPIEQTSVAEPTLLCTNDLSSFFI